MRFDKRCILPAAIAACALAACGAGLALILRACPAEPAVAAAPELLVYTSNPSDMVEYVVREYRRRSGVALRVEYSSTGSHIEHMRSKDDPGRADVLWGGGVETLESARDLFLEYRSVEDGAIDPQYEAADGRWHPFSVLPVVIVYNTRLVPPARAPASWAGLLDPYFKGHIIMADPSSSGLSFTAVATMLSAMSGPGGEAEGWAFLESFASQLAPAAETAGAGLAYNAVASGAFFASVALENFAIQLRSSGADLGFRYPREGTSAVPDGVALFATSRNAAEAGRFIDFLLGRDVQSLLKARWDRRSVRLDVEGRVAEGMTLAPYKIADMASRRPAILERWKALVSPAGSRP